MIAVAPGLQFAVPVDRSEARSRAGALAFGVQVKAYALDASVAPVSNVHHSPSLNS
jgi:hypothetical protein